MYVYKIIINVINVFIGMWDFKAYFNARGKKGVNEKGKTNIIVPGETEKACQKEIDASWAEEIAKAETLR